MGFPYFLSVSISILNTFVCKLVYRRADGVILTPKHLTEMIQMKNVLISVVVGEILCKAVFPNTKAYPL
jgi:hypothetical protein